MPRLPRAVLPEVPHHLTQRGVDRRPIFFTDSDRRIYLDLVRVAAQRFGVSILGYCMMPNHVHWIVVPARPDSLAKAFGQAHCRYAHYTNAALNRCGHFWQNRFFSCALDRAHCWAALRYVERNPVRAGLTPVAEDWPWSSAAAHLGDSPPEWLNLDAWRAAFNLHDWRVYLTSPTITEADLLLRINTYNGRPLGSAAFVDKIEATLGRPLIPRKGGRPRQQQGNPQALLFGDGGNQETRGLSPDLRD
jgi:putative transposase